MRTPTTQVTLLLGHMPPAAGTLVILWRQHPRLALDAVRHERLLECPRNRLVRGELRHDLDAGDDEDRGQLVLERLQNFPCLATGGYLENHGAAER